MGTFWSNVRGQMARFMHRAQNSEQDGDSAQEEEAGDIERMVVLYDSDTVDTAPYHNDSSSEEEPQEGGLLGAVGVTDKRGAVENTFDTALPVEHNYLGTDLEELRGRTVLDDGSYQSLPLLLQDGVVLVPGQTLPLVVYHFPTVSMLRNCVATDRTFGAVCIKTDEEGAPKVADIGTTAEIYEFREEDERAGFRVKAKGRQRFSILEMQRQIDGNERARVCILPEVVLPDPLHEVRLVSSDRHRSSRNSCRFASRDALMTRWPLWVYAQYQTGPLVQRVKQQVSGFHFGISEGKLPSDPVELSFWVAQALPLQDEKRLELLKLDSAIQRLRWELSIFDKCHVLCCRECGSKVAEHKDIFQMSVEGPQGTYVNPGGYVHDTITVYRAIGLQTISSRPSTEYTWFPGYAWTIAECRRCRRHMGWKFTATKKHLKPSKFWGLCRKSLRPEMSGQDEPDFKPVM